MRLDFLKVIRQPFEQLQTLEGKFTDPAVCVVDGKARSGKSYLFGPRYLCDHYIPQLVYTTPDGAKHLRPGSYWTTIELIPNRIAEWLETTTGVPATEILERIHVIPKETQQKWMEGVGGPWSYFQNINLENATIVIDEVHLYVSRTSPAKTRQAWSAFTGGIGHRGDSRIIMMSQTAIKLPKEVIPEAALIYRIVNKEIARDPIFFIPYRQWYELKAGLFTKDYRSSLQLEELTQDFGKKEKSAFSTWPLDTLYFDFYKSHGALSKDDQTIGGRRFIFKEHSRLGILWWFFKRNWFLLILNYASIGLVLCMLWNMGLGTWCFQYLNRTVQTGFSGMTAKLGKTANVKTASTVDVDPTRQSTSPVPDAQLTQKLNDSNAELVTTKNQLTALHTQYATAILKIEQQNNRIAELQQQLTALCSVTILTPNDCWFRDIPYSYRVGEKIDLGPWTGRTIRDINSRRREVTLDNGTILRGLSSRPLSPDGVQNSTGILSGMAHSLQPSSK